MSRELPRADDDPLEGPVASLWETPLERWVVAGLRRGLGSRAQLERAARAAYRAASGAPHDLSGLPRRLLSELRAVAQSLPEVVETHESEDGTEKLALALADGQRIEAVLIPAARSQRSRAHMRSQAVGAAGDSGQPGRRRPARASGCLSTQVGCAVGCRFCASGLLGLSRNLSAGEITAQALRLRQRARERGLHLGSLVVMGMGEPLHNVKSLSQALHNLTARHGGEWGRNQITVSTVGVVAGLEQLAELGPAVDLALSLHAVEDGLRRELVPLTRGLPPLAETLAAAGAYARAQKRRVTVSYVLLDEVNDSPAAARRLAELVREHGLDHVNLIPWNQVPGLPYRPAPAARAQAFWQAIRAAGVPVHLRRARGQEAAAACGQLARRSVARLNPAGGSG